MKEQSKAKLILDGEEYIFGEKYFMLSTNGRWFEKELFGYDFTKNTKLKFMDENYTWYSQISKTDPSDKRNLLKGYGVVCANQEQANIMQEFVGDMFNSINNFNTRRNTLQYSSAIGAFIWQCNSMFDGEDYNHLGNITFEQACEMCGIEMPKPKMRYMTAMEVIQKHTDKCVYISETGIFRTDFNGVMDVELYKVCRDKTKPIDEWVLEELKVEDK